MKTPHTEMNNVTVTVPSMLLLCCDRRVLFLSFLATQNKCTLCIPNVTQNATIGRVVFTILMDSFSLNVHVRRLFGVLSLDPHPATDVYKPCGECTLAVHSDSTPNCFMWPVCGQRQIYGRQVCVSGQRDIWCRLLASRGCWILQKRTSDVRSQRLKRCGVVFDDWTQTHKQATYIVSEVPIQTVWNRWADIQTLLSHFIVSSLQLHCCKLAAQLIPVLQRAYACCAFVACVFRPARTQQAMHNFLLLIIGA